MIRALTGLAKAALSCALMPLLFLAPGRAQETAVDLSSETIHSFTQPLEWRGGLEVESNDRRFGGFSGLAVSRDCARLVAISDLGWWLTAELDYRDGRLVALKQAAMAPILDDKGGVIKGKEGNDAEAVALWQPGRIEGGLIVAYESRVRIGSFAGLQSPFKPLAAPADIAAGPANEQIEALGRFHSGPLKDSFVAISERNLDSQGHIRAWIWGGERGFAFSLKQHEDYAITDLAILSDGDILTLERSFSRARPIPGMAIRRIAAADIAEGAAVAPKLLFEARAPFHQVDNMEGIAVCNLGGELRVTVISDDNYNRPPQRTLLLQFALKP